MEIDLESLTFVRNETTRQFEVSFNGKKSYIEFEQREGKVFLTGSEVPTVLADTAIPDFLVLKTFEHLEENAIPLVPMCKIVKEYIRSHPEWKRILAKGIQIDERPRF